MKALRTLLVIFLILIILGGVGYIGWSYYSMGSMGGHQNTSTTQNSNNNSNNTNKSNQDNMGQNNQASNTNGAQNNTTTINLIATQNRDKLVKAVNTINQALSLITIDPYSKTTVPSNNTNQSMQQGNMGSSSQGNVYIYPNGNSSVNVHPNSTTPNNNTPMQGNAQNQNYVYDQTKLEQLHNGIYTLAQGMSDINDLSDDLLAQSAMVEDNPVTYQTYVQRFNTALSNKNKLDNIINKISQASVLVNINPYALQNGYAYNLQGMSQLHQGIYKLAQGVSLLNKLEDNFTNQMVQASSSAQNLLSNSNMSMTTNAMQGHNMGSLNLNATTIIQIILLVLLFALIIGIIGAILSMIRKRRVVVVEKDEVVHHEQKRE